MAPVSRALSVPLHAVCSPGDPIPVGPARLCAEDAIADFLVYAGSPSWESWLDRGWQVATVEMRHTGQVAI